MFPYPSGEGLHIGHAFVYSLGDIYARFKRMQGLNVFYPVGYDSLGLPAENAAIKAGIHPKKYTENAIKNFMKQQKAMGWSYDWSRMVKSSDSDFYKWDQWIFLKMLEKGIAYRKKAPVNWCPKCKTVLANEQVINGKCWRHEDTNIEIRQLEQWFFKITKYAERLLKGLEKIDWPERAKVLQRNWIGKSYGTEIIFRVNGKKWPIFTTRPDTIFGVTFMVVSAQHLRLMELVTDKEKNNVENFLKKVKSVSEKEMEDLEKKGAFTGSYAINPVNNEKIPIYVGNFVVADYGSGMVMAVPAHDQRDFEFAKKYKIKIKEVISRGNITRERAYADEGKLINSEKFNGINSDKAKSEITKFLEKKKLGRKKIEYKLRDWLVSRQRYWGTPIPVIYCDGCGIVSVSEKDLPIKLPEKVKFGKGNPLKTVESWVNVKCPKCGKQGRRETDTMDTFVNSSWYYLRYTDSKNKKQIFDKKKANYWAPIDQYIGGPEHITMHLIYIRFYTKFLRDLGLLKFDEPAPKYFTQGVIYGEDGERMSKSKGNIIEPSDIMNKYGTDTLRLYLFSSSSPDKDMEWSDKEIHGSFKFINRIYNYFSNFKKGEIDVRTKSKLNKTIKEVTEDIENFRHNLAIIKLREFFNSIFEKKIDKKTAESFLKLLSVFCPHIAEELWQKIGNKGFISLQDWPKAGKVNPMFEKQEEMTDKLVNDINNILNILKDKKESPKKVYVYVIPNERNDYIKEELDKVSLDIEIFAVNDKNKYDPKGISKKTKPGKPGIYIE
tara:strand:- start:8229 stop:10556 length:2328 start_codon:yes stop_codon:yes gene_type:complete